MPFGKRIGMKKIILSADGLSLEDLVAVARKGARVALSEKSKKAIRKSRNLVEQWGPTRENRVWDDDGFGALSDVVISKEDTRKLQQRRSHEPCCGRWPRLGGGCGQGGDGTSDQRSCKRECGNKVGDRSKPHRAPQWECLPVVPEKAQ